MELGSCGLDTAGSGSGTRAFAPSLALGPANPFVHCLTMAGCGACFEVQCGNDSVSSQVRCVCVCVWWGGGKGRGVGGGEDKPGAEVPAGEPSGLTLPLLMQAAGCFVSASGGTASINVTVMDACPGCRGRG